MNFIVYKNFSPLSKLKKHNNIKKCLMSWILQWLGLADESPKKPRKPHKPHKPHNPQRPQKRSPGRSPHSRRSPRSPRSPHSPPKPARQPTPKAVNHNASHYVSPPRAALEISTTPTTYEYVKQRNIQPHQFAKPTEQGLPKIADITQVQSGKQCISMVRKFVERPPSMLKLHTPILNPLHCMYDITKILIRINSTEQANVYDYMFVYLPPADGDEDHPDGRWHLLNGKAMTRDETDRDDWTPVDLIRYLCSSIVTRQGRARLEVEVTFKPYFDPYADPRSQQSKKMACHPLTWKESTVDEPGVDDELTSLTRHKPNLRPETKEAIEFLPDKNNRPSSYPGHLFEFQLPNVLRYTYDFARNRQISLWEEEEMQFQERGYQVNEKFNQRYKHLDPE
jgi:hypothetical protein